MRALLTLGIGLALAGPLVGQTLYVPSGSLGTSSNSNVGIGISSPTNFGTDYQVLDLYKNGTFSVFIARTPSVSFEIQTVEWGMALLGTRTNHPLIFRVHQAEAMRISPGGNVGIGTTTPSHKLAVNGTIRAKEVIVDTGWADYVFAADYRLAPLSEVEAHIRDKRHLPGIPTAAEVAEHGVSLGEI